jgi:hypothetical protein
VNRGQELLGVAAGEVSSAYGAGEEGVSSQQESLVREVEADTAFGVAGGVEDRAGEAGDGDELAVVEGVVGVGDGWGGDAKPGGLDVHHLYLSEIVLVVEDGCAGELLETVGAGDVVDVGVGDDDLLDGEGVFGEEGEDAGDVVAGVDDDGFARGLVAEDGAVALEGADGEDLVDHVSSLWQVADGVMLICADAIAEKQIHFGMTERKARTTAKAGQRQGQERMRKPVACAFYRFARLLLRGRCLGGGGPGAGEDGVVSAGAREQNRQADGAEHEDDGGVGGQLGEEVGCAARAEGCLRALTAEGTGQVGGLALLEKDDSDEKERNDNVKSNEKTDQHSACNLLSPERDIRGRCVDWCEGGTCEPYALRR